MWWGVDYPTLLAADFTCDFRAALDCLFVRFFLAPRNKSFVEPKQSQHPAGRSPSSFGRWLRRFLFLFSFSFFGFFGRQKRTNFCLVAFVFGFSKRARENQRHRLDRSSAMAIPFEC